MRDVFEEDGYPLTRTTNTYVPNKDIKLINRYGNPEKVKLLQFNGLRKTLHIKTKTGVEQQVTLNHPLLVLDNGYMVWREAQNIKEGDFLVSRIGDNVFGNNKTFTPEEAYIWGALVADASYGSREEIASISFTNNEPIILDIIKKYFESLTGNERKLVEKQGSSSGTKSISLGRGISKQLVEKYGLQYGLAKDKYVPKGIMNAPRETVIQFLTGLLECECSFSGSTLEITSASKELLKDVKLLLGSLGIVSSLKDKVVVGYEHNDYYRLFVMADNLSKLLDIIEFRTDNRKNTVKEIKEILDTRAHKIGKAIPDIEKMASSYYKSSDISYRTRETSTIIGTNRKGKIGSHNILKLLSEVKGDPNIGALLTSLVDDKLYFDEVTEVYEGETIYTYDVTMSETHSFVAEGLINHNSSMAVNLTKEAQTYGVPILWINY